jgi:hypothetical protein
MPPRHPTPRLPFLVRATQDDGEPVTESLIKLLVWMNGPPSRSQRTLADACGTSQQRISQILLRQARPAPGSDLAEMLSLVTEGQVTVDGWLLPVEVQAREARREHARQSAVRVRDAERVTDARIRLPTDALGRAGQRLGLVPPSSAPRHRRSPACEPRELEAGENRSPLATVDTAALIAELSARLVQPAVEAQAVMAGKG